MNTAHTEQFTVIEVLAVSCAVHKMQGYVKKSHPYVNDIQHTPNVNYLYNHFCNGDTYPYDDEDLQQASAILHYLKGLGFKALERKLTEFESNVLKFVSAETVTKDRLGIAASLPNVYQIKLEADVWAARENQLGCTSTFVGQLGSRCTLNLKVENLRFISSTNSSLISCSENNQNIVKFFTTPESQLQLGKYLTLKGYVKGHNISSYTGFKETMLNRIKILNIT